MVAFLCRLVQRAPVLVTFIVSVVIEDKTRNEVDRFLTGEHTDKKERFRCVSVLQRKEAETIICAGWFSSLPLHPSACRR